MASFMKKAIREAFVRLLNEKPLSQITVKDIVEECGINRNSFYYHYADLPTLLEEITREECDEIIRKYPTLDSLEQCLDVAVEFVLSNKRAVMHVFRSSNREMYERYLWKMCDYAVTTYLHTTFSGRNVRESDRRIIIRFFKCECFGQIVDWLENDMSDELTASFHRLYELRSGQVEMMIRRCEEAYAGDEESGDGAFGQKGTCV